MSTRKSVPATSSFCTPVTGPVGGTMPWALAVRSAVTLNRRTFSPALTDAASMPTPASLLVKATVNGATADQPSSAVTAQSGRVVGVGQLGMFRVRSVEPLNNRSLGTGSWPVDGEYTGRVSATPPLPPEPAVPSGMTGSSAPPPPQPASPMLLSKASVSKFLFMEFSCRGVVPACLYGFRAHLRDEQDAFARASHTGAMLAADPSPHKSADQLQVTDFRSQSADFPAATQQVTACLSRNTLTAEPARRGSRR